MNNNVSIIRKTVLLLIIISITGGYNALSQIPPDGKGGWTQLEPMSSPRFLGASCYLDGKIFASGGYDDSWVWMSSAEVYVIEDNDWFALPYMHMVRLNFTMESMNNKIYAIGGGENSSPAYTTIEEYDPEYDEWTDLGNIPGIVMGHSSCVLDNKIYVLGGYNQTMTGTIKTCRRYDPLTNYWDTIKSMQYASSNRACCTYDGRIYVFGGSRDGGLPTQHNKAEVYDPANDTWEYIKETPKIMMGTSAISIEEDEIILLINGYRMYAYYPSLDEYKRMKDIPQYHSGSSAVKDGRFIYLVGGEKPGGTVLAELWRFNLDSLQEWIDPNATSIEYNKAENIPFRLQVVYPNPVVETTEINYELYIPGEVKLEIYNVLGKRLAVLADQSQVPGTYRVIWNAEGVIPGIYFCKLNVNGYGQILKLIKLR